MDANELLAELSRATEKVEPVNTAPTTADGKGPVGFEDRPDAYELVGFPSEGAEKDDSPSGGAGGNAHPPVAEPLAQGATPPPPLDEADFGTPPPQAEQEPPQPANWKQQAKMYLKSLDRIQRMVLPFLYKKAILEENDPANLAAYQAKRAADKSLTVADAISDNDELYWTLERYRELDEACTAIPLTDEDYQYLTDPLGQVIQKHRALQAGPEGQLVLALLIVMTPRLAPLLKFAKK